MAKPIPFQQMTVEYVVEGELDGVTPAPVLSIDPDSDDYVAPDERGIRVVRVEGNLGLIDPDFNGLGAQGDRCIPWLYLDSGGIAGAADSQFAVVDVQEQDGIVTPVAQVPQRFNTGGIPRFFTQKPTCIPQGSSLAVVGYPAGGEKIVRINVVAPSTALEAARIQQACCCSDFPCLFGDPQINGITPSFFPLIGQSTALVDGLFLYTIRPDSRPGEAPEGNLYPYDFVWVGQDTDDTLPTEVTDFRVLSPFSGATVVEVTFTPTPNFETGVYQLVGFDPFDPDCNTAGQETTPPSVFFDENPPICPDVTGISGDISFQVPGTSGLEIDLTGTDLGTLDGGPNFTATLTTDFPAPGSLPVTLVFITVDDVSATVRYDFPIFLEGFYTLTLSTPGCPDIVFEDIVFGFPA